MLGVTETQCFSTAPEQIMDEEDREWPEPSVPVFLYPRIAVPLVLVGVGIQYLWAQFILPTVGFYSMMGQQMSDAASSLAQFIEAIVGTITSFQGPGISEAIGGIFVAFPTMAFFMGLLIVPFFLIASFLSFPVQPSGSALSRE